MQEVDAKEKVVEQKDPIENDKINITVEKDRKEAERKTFEKDDIADQVSHSSSFSEIPKEEKKDPSTKNSSEGKNITKVSNSNFEKIGCKQNTFINKTITHKNRNITEDLSTNQPEDLPTNQPENLPTNQPKDIHDTEQLVCTFTYSSLKNTLIDY